MLSTKLSSKGQLVVPKAIRTQLNIEPGTFLEIEIDNGKIILTPMKEGPIEKLYGKFEGETILDDLEKEHAHEIKNENRS